MTFLPAAVYRMKMSGSEFKLLTAFFELADPYGRVRMDKRGLSEATGISLATLTRSFRKLEQLALLETTRRRKGRNYFDENAYQLQIAPTGEPFPAAPLVEPSVWLSAASASGIVAKSPSLNADAAPASPSLTDEQSTGDYVAPVVVSTSSQVSGEETDLLRKSLSPEQSSVEKNQSVNISEGNLELKSEPVKRNSPSRPRKAGVKPRVNNPRDARTRNLRPERAWNTYDVAAEFCSRINGLRPDLPPLMNAKNVSGALSKMRKELSIGPAEELYLMEKFLVKNTSFGSSNLVREPEKILGKFLNTFKTDLGDAREYGPDRLERREEDLDRLRYPDKWARTDLEAATKREAERELRRLEAEAEEARREAARAAALDEQRLKDAHEAEQLREHRAMRAVTRELSRTWTPPQLPLPQRKN